MFMQYAMVASQEALEDAGWAPKTDVDQEMTVGFAQCHMFEQK